MENELAFAILKLAEAHEKLAVNIGRIADQMAPGSFDAPQETAVEMVRNALSDLAEAVREARAEPAGD